MSEKCEPFIKLEPIKRSNSMFLHPSPDIDIKVIRQIGDYSLGAELGSGAFGKVVLGKHILTNELVAIKILDKMILNNTPDDYQSVKQEINILKTVKHKHIVQLYEVLQTPRHIFIIMEYCEGKDLLDYILTKNKLSEEESLKFFQQLINALFYLHSQNIAHRDIKIDNMLLDRNRDLKLVDFGLSTKYPDDNLLDQPCGTVVYAAPEVLQGKEYHGMLADVWSSGIVLYGMLSGYLPFGEANDEINKQNIIRGKIKFPSYFSYKAKDLLMHMLDLDPMTRYTLQEIRNHPWFNLVDYKLIPGIIIGYNKIPVDESILNLCVSYNCDKEKVRDSIINNKHNSNSAFYYLLIKKLQKKGFTSVSDFSSDEFINFVLDDNNLIDSSINREKDSNKIQDTEIKYNIPINANNHSSAPPAGKLDHKENKQENNDNNENGNLITPKDSRNINKKIDFNESSKGVLSFILNTSSCKETNNELKNKKNSISMENRNTKGTDNITNNILDNESKKIYKNTSSDSRQRNLISRPGKVNNFEIIDENNEKKLNQKKVNNVLEDKFQINNIFIDSNNPYKKNNSNRILDSISHQDIDTDRRGNTIDKENNINRSLFGENKFGLNNINISKDSDHITENKNGNNQMNERNKLDSQNKQIFINGKINISDSNINKNNKSIELVDSKGNNHFIISEFIIETPKNKDKDNNNNISINGEFNCSKNINSLSKQKVYIDKNKTLSEKNKNQDKNKLDINKIKDLRKINLFQDEIKEEEPIKINKDKKLKIIEDITDRELNHNSNEMLNQNIPVGNREIIKEISKPIESNNDSNTLNDKFNKQINKEFNNSTRNKNINKDREDTNKMLIEEKNINIENDNIKDNNMKEFDLDNENNNNIDQKKAQSKENQDIKKKKNENKIKKKKKIIKKYNKTKTDAKILKNPIIYSILKNYKAIIDTNKSVEMIKSQKSTSKERNVSSHNSKNKKKKNDLTSLKIINKKIISKDKNKLYDSKNKNKSEKQEIKIKNIYRRGKIQNNLSKNVINKNPTISQSKNKLIKNYFTNKKYMNRFELINLNTHTKSSSSHAFSTISKNNKHRKNVINNNNTLNTKSLNITKNYIKSKKKKTTNSKFSKRCKKIIENNLWLKSYNNKYLKLFKSTQYKNSNLLFANKIDKTNLNKKFDEIAHKVNKSTKTSKNKLEDKKIPLWKYIQSDQYYNQNNSIEKYLKKGSIKTNIKNSVIKLKNGNNKNARKNIIQKKNAYEHKTIDNISCRNSYLNGNNTNINKLDKNNNNRSESLTNGKNINVYFINIHNYFHNNKNRQNKNYLDSSVINQRHKSPNDVRELSESLKNKYLNKKTRYAKIPWKIKKKAIDEKIDINYLYNFYAQKTKNPLRNNNNRINNNKKTNNIKPINNSKNKNKIFDNQLISNLNNKNGIRINLNKSTNNKPINGKKNLKKLENIFLTNKNSEIIKSNYKKYNINSYTPQYIHKTNIFYNSNFTQINQRNIYPNKLFNTNTSRENKTKNNSKEKNQNNPIVFDLSCLFCKSENINECYQHTIDKLINNKIYFAQKTNKVIRCFKYWSCDVEILKVDSINNKIGEEIGGNAFCYKIRGKKGNQMNKLKNIIFEQN